MKIKRQSDNAFIEAEQYSEVAFGVPEKMIKGICVGGPNCYHGDAEGEAMAHLHINKTQSVVLEAGDWVMPDANGVNFYPVAAEDAEYESASCD